MTSTQVVATKTHSQQINGIYHQKQLDKNNDSITVINEKSLINLTRPLTLIN